MGTPGGRRGSFIRGLGSVWDPRGVMGVVNTRFGKCMGTPGGHWGSFIRGLRNVWGPQGVIRSLYMRFEKCPISVPLIIISIYLVIYIQEISFLVTNERTYSLTHAKQKK